MLVTLSQLPGWSIGLMVVGFLFICVILVLTVLIQRPQGGGLAGAFGSAAGSGQTAFGTKTGDALTIFTISMFIIYVLAAMGLNYVVRPSKPDAAAAAAAAPGSAPQTPAQPATPTNTPGGVTPAPAPTTPADGGIKIEPVTPPTEVPAGQAPAGTAPAATPASTPAATPSGEQPKPADPKPAEPKPQ